MTARRELDGICRQAWSEVGHEFKATSNSMGRVGLSCARRHPALLLGGGALLGFGAVLFLTRGKKRTRASSHEMDKREDEQHAQRESSSETGARKAEKSSKSARFAAGAAVRILKSAARMWLLEHLSAQPRTEQDHEGEPIEDDMVAGQPLA